MSEFDKNFKINVKGNFCEYQQDKYIDLTDIKSISSYRSEMGWPFKFYLKSGGYEYIPRAEIGKQIQQAVLALGDKQAELDDLKAQLNNMEACYIQKKKQVDAVEHILGCAMIGPKEVFQYAERIQKALRGEK